MSDEFERRDWAEDLNEGVRNRDTWFRGLKIIVLILFLAVARFALLVTVIYQFCFCLVRNRPSEIMLPVGRWLASYVEKAILFITWNSDHAPFPFTHFNRVMEPDSNYQDEEPAYPSEDEVFSNNEEISGAEQPVVPTAEDEIADDEPEADEPADGQDNEESDVDENDRSTQPPRPDA